MPTTGLAVRYLAHNGEYLYYTGTTWGGVPEYTTNPNLARLMNERHATLAAQAVSEDGYSVEIVPLTQAD